ncbi:MAG: PQQ-binding-like beta-propeller repeat protein [Dehalococcoidales bacterium]|nr:PQQ-binding-like beta-propeller repeat protein [Dehalococcoidales bacterium]
MTARGTPESNQPGRMDKDQLWLICPICKNANPSGTLHCKFCWGPSLYAVEPISTAELEAFKESYRAKQKKLGLLRNLIVYLGAPLLIFGGIVFWMYNFTDLILAPPAHMNSSSFPGESAMFRYNVERSGSTSVTAVNPTGVLQWSFKTNDSILTSPVVVNDTVYCGSNDYNMYAIDIATGQKKWQYTTGSWVESTPAVVNGIIYFGSNDGKFYALDAATGSKIWIFDTAHAIKTAPAVADGIVYFGCFDKCVYALDALTGAQIWKYQTGSYILSSPVVSGGVLYIGSNDNSCYAFNAGDGRFRLKLSYKEVSSSPAVNNNVVYFTSERYLVAMDGKARNWPLETGIRYWWGRFYFARILPPPPPITGGLWATRISFKNTTTTPVCDEDSIYTTGDSKVYRVDAATHKITWTFYTDGFMSAAPGLANGIVYAGSEDGKLYAIGAVDGNQLWNFQTGGKILAGPTYAKGVVYVAADDGVLYAIK